MSQNTENNKSSISQVYEALKAFVESEKTMQKYRKSDTDFIRSSALSFAKTVYLILSNMSNSLSVELYNVLERNAQEQVSKSAFSQRRYLILPELFHKLNDILIEKIYSATNVTLKKWHGFTLSAIDGTVLTLPNTPDIKKFFGVQKGGPKKRPNYTPQARHLIQYDVLNRLILRTELQPITVGERTMMYNWVSSLQMNTLTMFDRGFSSFLLFYLMLEHKKPFIARLSLTFNNPVKAFVASGALDEIVTFSNSSKIEYGGKIIPAHSEIRVRLVRVTLPDGGVEVLATSLLDEIMYPTTIFGEAYNLRWGVETCIDILKNKFLTLCFTGIKPDAILQETYANIVLFNLHQLLVLPAQVAVNERVKEHTITQKAKGKDVKHEQKVNDNVSIGILKPLLFTLWITPDITKLVDLLVLQFAKSTVPIRKNRSFKRKKSLAKRRNLTTQTNFRRAA